MIPTQTENPKGFHGRYVIKKIQYLNDGSGINKRIVPVDKDAEYFVMRLDTGGSDPEHIKACRIGVNAYADAIEHHLPELAKDLRERYPQSLPSVKEEKKVCQFYPECAQPGFWGNEKKWSDEQIEQAMGFGYSMGKGGLSELKAEQKCKEYLQSLTIAFEETVRINDIGQDLLKPSK